MKENVYLGLGTMPVKCTDCNKTVWKIKDNIKAAHNPIIDTTYKLLVSENKEEIEQYLKENLNNEFESTFFEKNGETYYRSSGIIMWAKNDIVAVHELVHAIFMPYNHYGIAIEEELVAYTMKFLYKALIADNGNKTEIVFTNNK